MTTTIEQAFDLSREIIQQLSRIADALEGQRNAQRSWAAIFGSAERNLSRQTTDSDAYMAMKLWGNYLSTQHGADPAVFPIIGKYATVDAMVEAIESFLKENQLNWDEKSIKYHARSIGYALRNEGLWDY